MLRVSNLSLGKDFDREKKKQTTACKPVLQGYRELKSKSNWFKIDYKNSDQSHAFHEAPGCIKQL